MFSFTNYYLEENIFDDKLRERSEVYIIKDKRLLVCPGKNNKLTFPGGALDKNETPKMAAERETLEEVGIKIKIIRQLSPYEFNYVKEIGPWEELPEKITKWNEIGMRTYPFIAEFIKEDKHLFNIEGDGRKYVFMSSKKILNQLKKIDDPYFKIRVIHQIKIIEELKKENLIY